MSEQSEATLKMLRDLGLDIPENTGDVSQLGGGDERVAEIRLKIAEVIANYQLQHLGAMGNAFDELVPNKNSAPVVLAMFSGAAGVAMGKVMANNFTGPPEKAQEFANDLGKTVALNLIASYFTTKAAREAAEARDNGQVQ